MIICPYCNGQNRIDFRSGAGSLDEDDLNQKTLTIMIHSHGCERWFLAVQEKIGGEILACFKAPLDWRQAIPSTNPPNPPI